MENSVGVLTVGSHIEILWQIGSHEISLILLLRFLFLSVAAQNGLYWQMSVCFMCTLKIP
jgi:hypothetical protein